MIRLLTTIIHKNLAVLDRPEIVNFLFYPRRESGGQPPENVICKEIPMPDGTPVGIRIHWTAPDLPVILFFHGNGEIAQDYNPIGQVFVAFLTRHGLAERMIKT